ncbi:hypothetical protein LXL04_016818 [Taraxacum kok-saghyz]
MADHGIEILQIGIEVLFNLVLKTIKEVIRETRMFKQKLHQMHQNLTKYKDVFVDAEKLLQKLGRVKEAKMFSDRLKEGEALVRKCGRVKWKIWKISSYSKNLDTYNASFLTFCQQDLQFAKYRSQLKVEVYMKEKKNSRYYPGRPSSPDPMLKVHAAVPPLKNEVIGFESFDQQVRRLKDMVLEDSDYSVVVVTAPKGCGKTTSVTMLCHDPQIKGRFGRNIYFVTISKTPNLKTVIKNLLGMNEADFINEDDAINHWESFVGRNRSEILLVLDDVCSDSIIKQFMLKFRGYKILATSTTTYKQFDTYNLQPLSDHDATTLFRQFAFSESGGKNYDIPNDIVDKLVKYCNNHPQVLSVIGGLLKGKQLITWVAMLNNFSGESSGESCDMFEDSKIKQFISDLEIYPDDQKISPKMLMDRWVHLKRLDEVGSGAEHPFFPGCFKKHASTSPTRWVHLKRLDEVGSGAKHPFFPGCFKKPATTSPTRMSTSSRPLMADAASLGVGLGLEDAVSRLSAAIENANAKSSHFRKKLKLIQDIITRNEPFFYEIGELVEASDQPIKEKKKFIAQLKSAETVVLKCERVKLNLYKKYKYSKKLDKLTASLSRFCQFYAPWAVGKGILDLLVARDLGKKH